MIAENGGSKIKIALVLLRSFDYGEGAHYPWVKVQFPINDWVSRDAFADAIEAIRARHK